MPFRSTIRQVTIVEWTLFRVLVCFLVLGPVARDALAPGQSKSPAIADFIDVAEKTGLTGTNVFGGKQSSTYILESTGTGVAIFDYDNDGWPDIFLVNGTTLSSLPAKESPTNHI